MLPPTTPVAHGISCQDYAAAFAAAKLLGSMELVSMIVVADDNRVQAKKGKAPLGPLVESGCLVAACEADTAEITEAWVRMAWLAANHFATFEAITDALNVLETRV